MNRWKYDILMLSFYSFTLFYLLTTFKKLDIKDINSLLIEYLNAGHFPFPPGYYASIYLVDLIIRIRYPFVAAALLVLTFFLWWKYRLVFNWISNELKTSERQSFFWALGLIFLSPIYIPWIDGDFWYLGKFTSTIWHNSTLIAVFPFAILLMQFTLSWFELQTARLSLWIFAAGFFVALFKPSFLFCFIPAFPIYTLILEQRINRKVLAATGLSVLLFALVMLEKSLIFNWDPMIDQLYTEDEVSRVILSPMKVWLFFSDQPVFDFLSSFPLLLTFLLSWRKKAFQSHFFSFSLLNLLFALLIYALFSETGFREFHGNFYWQIPIALFLTNLSIGFVAHKDYLISQPENRSRHFLLFGIFLLQAFLGVIYWFRIFFGDTLS